LCENPSLKGSNIEFGFEFSLLWTPAESAKSEEKEGGTQTREEWSPLLVSGSLINEPREERDCVGR
jgi:hypothetical protein